MRQNYAEDDSLDDPLETLQFILDGLNRQQAECDRHKAEIKNLMTYYYKTSRLIPFKLDLKKLKIYFLNF